MLSFTLSLNALCTRGQNRRTKAAPNVSKPTMTSCIEDSRLRRNNSGYGFGSFHRLISVRERPLDHDLSSEGIHHQKLVLVRISEFAHVGAEAKPIVGETGNQNWGRCCGTHAATSYDICNKRIEAIPTSQSHNEVIFNHPFEVKLSSYCAGGGERTAERSILLCSLDIRVC